MAKVRQALMGGFASSRILEVHGERMIKRTFNPGFRIGLHQKDLNLALQGSKALSMAQPQTAGAAQLMHACAAQGWDQLNHSALVKELESLAHHAGRPRRLRARLPSCLRPCRAALSAAALPRPDHPWGRATWHGTAPGQTAQGMKFSDSGSWPWIGVSKKSPAPSGSMVVRPRLAKKIAICRCAASA
jgi:hypothetical protein